MAFGKPLVGPRRIDGRSAWTVQSGPLKKILGMALTTVSVDEARAEHQARISFLFHHPRGNAQMEAIMFDPKKPCGC